MPEEIPENSSQISTNVYIKYYTILHYILKY